MLGGYAGQILYVDLSSQTVRKEPLSMEMAKKYIGGFGFNCKLAYDLIKPGIEPFSPENVLILSAGTLGGTIAPSSSRIAATTKFPETGTVASGNGSMTFALNLKQAGYDTVVISGRATTPVYLLIIDDEVKLCDAEHLWGRDLVDSTQRIWRSHGRSAGIICIGQAGENLVRISLALVDRIASLSKAGLAAVMGSKNLKAVAVIGTKGVSVSQPERFMKAVDRYFERVRNYELRDEWIRFGASFDWRNRLAYRHRSELYPPDLFDERYGKSTYLSKVRKARIGCPSCPMADKEVLEVREGKFRSLILPCSAWTRRNIDFGVHCDVGEYDNVIKCMDTANRYGIDSHSFAQVMDYAVHLYEQGIVTAHDTGGMQLKRDFDTCMCLLRMVAFREGIGDLLADGEVAIAKRFGPAAEKEMIQCKGMEITQDPRISGLGTMEFETLLNPMGGHHQAGGSPAYASGMPLERFISHCRRMGATPEAAQRIVNSPHGFNVGRLSRYAEDWYAILSSLGLCNRAQMNRFYSIESCTELYSSATGIEISPRELAVAAERIWNINKASNVREGFTRKDDKIPEKWFQPIKGREGELRLRNYYGDTELTREDIEGFLDDYYDERGWNRETGIPTIDKLVELDLADVASDLSTRGWIK